MSAATLDERDTALLAEYVAELDAIDADAPRVGDWVRFADGVERRVSYIWPDSVQTSKGGSWHLGNGFVSMSGALFTAVPDNTFTPTDETKDGSVWFFHHHVARADNGVYASVPFRVFACSLPSTVTR